MKNNMTTEQQQVFDRYFRTEGDQHIAKNDVHLHVAFFDFEIDGETDHVFAIRINDTIISMWKQVEHLHITIL